MHSFHSSSSSVGQKINDWTGGNKAKLSQICIHLISAGFNWVLVNKKLESAAVTNFVYSYSAVTASSSVA